MAIETTDAGLEEFNSYMRGEFAYERLSPEGKAQVDAYLDAQEFDIEQPEA